MVSTPIAEDALPFGSNWLLFGGRLIRRLLFPTRILDHDVCLNASRVNTSSQTYGNSSI